MNIYILNLHAISVTTIFLNNLGNFVLQNAEKFPSFFKYVSRPFISSLTTVSSCKTKNFRIPCKCYPNTVTLMGAAYFTIAEKKE